MKQIYGACLAMLMTLLLCAVPAWAQGQETVIRGRIMNEYGEALAHATISLSGSREQTRSDDSGRYELRTGNAAAAQVLVSAQGYVSALQKLRKGKTQVLNLVLREENGVLGEVVVRSAKKKYRNRDNPAVELIEQVIAHKPMNVLSSFSHAYYRQYEKMLFALSNTPQKLRRNFLLRRYPYMIANIDTTSIPGTGLLPWYMQERLAQVYYRHDPEKKKTVVSADKRVDFGEFIDNAGVNAYMKHMYQDVDLYKNDIYIFTNQFLSPVADNAPIFYKYFITDTVRRGADTLVELAFFPRNKADMLFQGKLLVTLDGRYAIPQAGLTVNKNINLNWVKSLHIDLDFSKDSGGFYTLAKSTVAADFGLLKNSTGGIYGKREVAYLDYRFDQPLSDSVYAGPALVEPPVVNGRPEEFWAASRPDSLTASEQQTYEAIERLSKSKSFKRTMDIATMVLAGYKRASPYVEVGPVNTFYGFNPVEGFRLRVGGRTTTTFSKRLNLETYAAYGFRDEKWKYYLGGAYSFTKRSIYEFPVVSLTASYQHDTKIPGQELQFVQEDNFLLSFKRGVNDRFLYNDIYRIAFLQEFRNHLSYEVSFKNWAQTPAGGLRYEVVENGQARPVTRLTTTEVGLQLRWAPGEKFYQGKLYRVPVLSRNPVFTLRTAAGIRNLLGGEYDYQRVTLNVYKRLFLSQLGYTDIVLEGGSVFGRAPYPLLDIHRANQSYSLQLESYNLMNFLEFVSDHYASLFVDHSFNGFFLNKMPLLKKAKLREAVNLKVLYGGLRDENNPAMNPDMLQFPADEAGHSRTFRLGRTPYIEGSVGIANIFNLFRIDLVKRFTYLDNPNISSLGIRGRFKFDF